MDNSKNYEAMIDLQDRTLSYAMNVRKLVKSMKSDQFNQDDLVQLIRSSGSVGANFIEAIESLSKKDFLYRMRICLKEAKESRYWLIIIENTINSEQGVEITDLKQESTELIRIFSTIIQKNKT